MNSCERYIATIKGEPVDFLPRVPILMQFAAEHIGSSYAAFAADYKVLVDAIHGRGGLVKLHICGNTTHILPHIAELGLDIFDLDHMIDPVAARQMLGPDTVIAGRVDPAQCVLNGTPETIRREVRESYVKFGNPHMVMAGCEIPSGTPFANLKALCEPVQYRA